MRHAVALFAVLLISVGVSQAQWAQTSGPGVVGVQALLVREGNLFAGTLGQGVFRSVDGGVTWTAANLGLEGATVNAIAANSTDLYAGLQFTDGNPGGVRRSVNLGQTWTDAGLHGQLVRSVFAADGYILAGTAGMGLYKSTNGGADWSPQNPYIGNQSVQAIVRCGTNLFAATDNLLYFSADDGDSWDFTNGGQYFNIFSLRVSGNFIYAGGFTGLIRSTDGGASFSDPIWIDFLPELSRITSFTVVGSTVYASVSGAPGAGVIQSTDNGLHWTPANTGIEIVPVECVEAVGTALVAGTAQKGILRSANAGAQWAKSNSGLPPGGDIRSLLLDGSSILAGTGGDGIYRTTDGGAQWTPISADPSGTLDDELVETLLLRGNDLLCGTFAHGAFRSTDHGAHWAQSNTGLPLGPYFNVFDLESAGTAVVAGTSSGIFRSLDGGQSWGPTSVADGFVFSLASEPGFAYAIVNTGIFNTTGIYRSTNEGLSWSLVLQAGTSDPIVLAAGDGFVYLGDLLSGIRRSSNHGIGWSGPSINGGVFSILPMGSTVYAGTESDAGSISVSLDHGGTWEPANDGLPANIAIEALAADAVFLFGGTDQEGVWGVPLSPAIVDDSPAATPARLKLRSVFPNPFSSSTSFDFSIPAAEEVRLSIYDMSGRAVGGPYVQRLPAGAHRWGFDGTRLPAGTYLYRLAAAGGVTTGKLVRLRP